MMSRTLTRREVNPHMSLYTACLGTDECQNVSNISIFDVSRREIYCSNIYENTRVSLHLFFDLKLWIHKFTQHWLFRYRYLQFKAILFFDGRIQFEGLMKKKSSSGEWSCSSKGDCADEIYRAFRSTRVSQVIEWNIEGTFLPRDAATP